MKKHFFLVLFVLTFVSLAYAAQQSKIELKNGNTLDGEILSFSEGKYTVKSPILGIFKIEESQVRAIHKTDALAGSPEGATALPGVASGNSEVQKIQSVIAANPDIMMAIPGLFANPEFQELLKDPEIMNAAKSSDIKALMANEKVARLVNNSEIREIGQKIQEKSS